MPFNVQSADGAACIGTLLRQPTYRAAFAERRSAVCGLLDFDQRGYGEWRRLRGDGAKTWTDAEVDDARGLALRHAEAPAWAMLLPVPAHRDGYVSKDWPELAVLEMEHLFTDERLRAFANVRKMPGGGSILVVPDGKKAAFAEAAAGFDDADFAPFKPILDRLDAVLGEIAEHQDVGRT